MGKFYAYKKAGDTLDVDLDTSSNITYYRIILSRAFGETNFVPSNDATAANIGTIDLKSSGLADEEGARKRIAEEEGKYFFRWRDKQNEDVMSDHGPVLKNLERVNVLLYWDTVRIVKRTHSSGRGFFDKSVQIQLKNQDSSIKELSVEPLKFEKIEEDKLKVSVQPKAIALYQDTVETTKVYKYKLVGQKYEAVQTWSPENPPLGLEESRAEGYSKFDKQLRTRYLQWGLYIAGYGKKNVPERALFCENDPKYRNWLNGLTLNGLTPEIRKRIVDSAEDAAKQIPQKYDCYYYADGDKDGDKIDGFLAYVDLDAGSSGAGSSGYKGRADKVTEVDYLWGIVPAAKTPEFLLARVLAYLIGLNGDPREKKDVDTNYHPTNYPYQREDKSADAAVDNPLLFRYFKKFLPDKERRNEPKDPMVPRLYPTSPKSADKSLRKWKKGLTLDGEELGFGNKATRLNAGGVMAKALREFNFYDAAETKSLSVIKMSTLPATAFAKYAVTNDTVVQNQWKTDKGLSDITVLDESAVRTEQEWCHLYGHGDGGHETLDNFVSGSKHCNTEQLAIESGQRRVSQNEDIDEGIRKRLKWRITAELFPNQGSARKAPDLKEVTKLLKSLDPTLRDTVIAHFFIVKGNTLTLKSDDLTLKSDDLVRSGLTELAKIITGAKKKYRDAVNNYAANKVAAENEVKILVKFQRTFLEQCFTYYPLGRFIRYRIFFDTLKCFEHLFDAQSESFDVNEAEILANTVEYAIYRTMEEVDDPKITLKFKLKAKAGPNDLPEDLSKDVSPLEFYKEIIKRRVRVAGLARNAMEKEIGEKLIVALDALSLNEVQTMDVEIKKEKKEELVMGVRKVIDERKDDINKNGSKELKEMTEAIKIDGFEPKTLGVEYKRKRSVWVNIEDFDSNFKKPKK